MSNNQKLTRSEHVASLALPPSRIKQTLWHLRRGDVLLRIGLCLAAMLLMWLITGAWVPPFAYRSGYVPPRDIVACIAFDIPDPEGTERLRKQKKSETKCVYVQDDRLLKELYSALKDSLFQILHASSYENLDKDVCREFFSESSKPTDAAMQAAHESLRTSLLDDMDLTRFVPAFERVFQQFEENGLLTGLEHTPVQGSQRAIFVHPLDKPDFLHSVNADDVRIGVATSDLKNELAEEFKRSEFTPQQADQLAELVYQWLMNHGLPTTLKWDIAATRKQYEQQVEHLRVEQAFAPGDKLARGGEPLVEEKLRLLREEYKALIGQMTPLEKLGYSLADFGMYLALYVLCGTFVYLHQPRIIHETRRLATLLAVVVATIALGRVCAGDSWQAEMVPVALFGMTITITHTRDLALLLSAAVALILCVSLGLGLAEFVLMAATTATAILLLNRVRSRTKLIYVGLGAGLIAFATTIGIGVLTGQPLGSFGAVGLLGTEGVLGPEHSLMLRVLSGAAWHGFCGVLVGLIMTGLLPFIERLFDVQTDISLLELGDAAHPLLQELARRAPGTYNHSINVASLAETAAEAIGANGLLVRVGAYFHDIGKVFKPGYFIENQNRETNLHESLLPAMSTLVIIAHVKDGADLARQHKLPQSIIDFIEQHHGTTLVEYFYQQATRQKEEDPDKEDVEESSFRYPGPKPRTRETGVLMLADAVESASRALVDPTPARIESLVQQIALKRLMDGQFGDCGITLRELNTLEDTLAKSLTAVYHARVKYPDQQTA